MPKPKVLFLCTGNSCRSQMAEGWLRHLAGDQFEVFSAGVKPVGVNPLAITAMGEVGIDISRQRSKHVGELLGQSFPYVVTVCDSAREQCPIFPGTFKKLHWSFEDPAAARGSEEQRLAVFRRVRDEIGERVREFVKAAAAQPVRD
jgi:arsenate reductase (thioredoxin)